jgi:hypothetical protein
MAKTHQPLIKSHQFSVANFISFCHYYFYVERAVRLGDAPAVNVEPGRKAGRRFDSSPFRHLLDSSNSLAKIEIVRPDVAGRQCL